MSRPHPSKLVQLVKKYTIAWSVVTAVLYFIAIPFTVFVFPATTLLLTVFVLFGGFTSSMSALGAALVSAEQAAQEAARASDTMNTSAPPAT